MDYGICVSGVTWGDDGGWVCNCGEETEFQQ